MSKKQLLKRELQLHGLEAPVRPPEGSAVPDTNGEYQSPAVLSEQSPVESGEPQSNRSLQPPAAALHTPPTDRTSHADRIPDPYSTDHTVHTGEETRNQLTNTLLKKEKKAIQSRRAKRKRGGLDREKWTTSLQPKYLDMLDVCSLKEGFRDMNEYVEYILERHARKIGYPLND